MPCLFLERIQKIHIQKFFQLCLFNRLWTKFIFSRKINAETPFAALIASAITFALKKSDLIADKISFAFFYAGLAIIKLWRCF